MALDLDNCYETVLNLAKEAGKVVKEAFSSEKRISTKSSVTDLVTESDQQVEAMIIGSLREKYPNHKFIGEESVSAGEKCLLTDDPTWVIDPIDGTMNFVHTYPFVAISIALVVDKKTMIGLIYNPVLDEMYTARCGKGAFCNGEKIQTSGTEDIGKALLGSEFGSQTNPDDLDKKTKAMRNLVTHCHSMRTLGSCAIGMCFVAAGKLDAFYEFGIHCWDIAAGDIIVREAGGYCCSARGGDFDMMSRNMLCAATKPLGETVLPHLIPVDYPRD